MLLHRSELTSSAKFRQNIWRFQQSAREVEQEWPSREDRPVDDRALAGQQEWPSQEDRPVDDRAQADHQSVDYQSAVSAEDTIIDNDRIEFRLHAGDVVL